MRVIPLTSILSHKGRGSRNPNLDDTLRVDVKELFKHPPKGAPRLLAALSHFHVGQLFQEVQDG
jgi:hypothetical protein